ncbi:MAG: class 1 fructose-bisphosphatase [Thermodesulfobacteriota bacterium]|nr:class 1 fructose-bisphosphatase [Thermodesulfobacteriota bacterium]
MRSSIGMTVTEHILEKQRENPEATGAFTRLLSEMIVAAKIISREVNKAGIADILGYAGRQNVQGEDVQKLDTFANDTIIERMGHVGQLCVMASEENADIIPIPSHYPKGKYVLIFDPLDGSSNIDVNVTIGTIFSIHRKTSNEDDATLSDVLQSGHRQVAAGYFIYGSSTMMVYTTGQGVHGFTLFPSIGEFLLSHENIRIPERGKIFSVNESYYQYWTDGVRRLVDHFKSPDTKPAYTARYVGSLVADFHRNLLKGGIFMYPADTKDPKKPHGKLRLMCEANPLAFVVKEAGGYASTGEEAILDIEPQGLHQRVPLFIGSKEDVRLAEEYVQGKV